MRRKPVRSGAVAAVGYDEDTHELEIEFHGGDVYRYTMVPASVHGELLAAGSIGAFVNRRVVPRYPARQVWDDA